MKATGGSLEHPKKVGMFLKDPVSRVTNTLVKVGMHRQTEGLWFKWKADSDHLGGITNAVDKDWDSSAWSTDLH